MCSTGGFLVDLAITVDYVSRDSLNVQVVSGQLQYVGKLDKWALERVGASAAILIMGLGLLHQKGNLSAKSSEDLQFPTA
jgi:hypothetical protein